MISQPDIMPTMAKRTTLHIPCSQEYKDEYKRLLEQKYKVGTADRLMAMDARALLEQEYPTLRDIANQERQGGRKQV